MTGGMYCLSCAREIQKYETSGLAPLFPLLPTFLDSMAPTTAHVEAKPKPASENPNAEIREALNDAESLAKELETIYPTRAKVRTRAAKLCLKLNKLRVLVLR